MWYINQILQTQFLQIRKQVEHFMPLYIFFSDDSEYP